MLRFIQASIGLTLMVYSFSMSEGRFKLLFDSKIAKGIIIDQEYVTSRSSTSGHTRSSFMPIVKFQVHGKDYQFKNYFGSNSAGEKGDVVTVLFSPENPNVAMIDNGWRNWIPWGPIFIMGFFIVLGSLSEKLNWDRNKIAPAPPRSIEEVHRLALAGNKVTAIKMYRLLSGQDLKGSKEYVEQFLTSNRDKK